MRRPPQQGVTLGRTQRPAALVRLHVKPIRPGGDRYLPGAIRAAERTTEWAEDAQRIADGEAVALTTEQLAARGWTPAEIRGLVPRYLDSKKRSVFRSADIERAEALRSAA